MVKSLQIKKVVNGEIADADDVNQIVENAGSEGGLIPYSEINQQHVTNGSESLGSTSYPWGSLKVDQNAELVEVTTTNHSAVASVLWKNLRRFIFLKDAPNSYTGHAKKNVRVNVGETGLEFAASESIPLNIQTFKASGTWTRPANVNKVWVRLWGAGGGGAGGDGTSKGGGGGGGGGYAEGLVAVSGNVTVTVGAKGVGGGLSGAAGANGGDSSFVGDATLSAEGGDGAAIHSGAAGVGGAAGGVPGGEIAINGMPGEDGHEQFGGTGGSSFGSAGAAGGRSTSVGAPGQTALMPGAGGGGGSGDGASGGAGGDGADGMVEVIY